MEDDLALGHFDDIHIRVYLSCRCDFRRNIALIICPHVVCRVGKLWELRQVAYGFARRESFGDYCVVGAFECHEIVIGVYSINTICGVIFGKCNSISIVVINKSAVACRKNSS